METSLKKGKHPFLLQSTEEIDVPEQMITVSYFRAGWVSIISVKSSYMVECKSYLLF